MNTRIVVDHCTELRQRELADVDELFALTDANRTYLRAWLPWLDHCTSPEHTRQNVERALEQAADGTGLALSIWHRGWIVGVTGYNDIVRADRIGHIGYWLAREQQGKGIMTASVRALVDFGFRELGLNRQTICAAVDNVASRAVAERVGFTFEGIAREAQWLYDHFVDHAVYSMLEQQYLTQPLWCV